jgi:hypothetical protein
MPIASAFRQSNGRSEDARLEHHRRYCEKVIGRDREVRGRLFSEWPVRPEVQVAGRFASVLRLVRDRNRRPLSGSPVFGRQGLAHVRRASPEGERVASSPPTRRGTSLHGLQASQPFPLVRVIKIRRQRRERLHRAHGEGEASGVVARKGFDSQGAGGYSPLGFPLFGGLCWASSRQSETWGGAAIRPLVRGESRGLARGQIRRVKSENRPALQPEPGTMSMGR